MDLGPFRSEKKLSNCDIMDLQELCNIYEIIQDRPGWLSGLDSSRQERFII